MNQTEQRIAEIEARRMTVSLAGWDRLVNESPADCETRIAGERHTLLTVDVPWLIGQLCAALEQRPKCGNRNCQQREGHAGTCDDGLRSIPSTRPDNEAASVAPPSASDSR